MDDPGLHTANNDDDWDAADGPLAPEPGGRLITTAGGFRISIPAYMCENERPAKSTTGQEASETRPRATTQIGGIWSAVPNRDWMLVIYAYRALHIHQHPAANQTPSTPPNYTDPAAG